jgi:radical SAM superfamily enzyme YgiQ (UPF0313 family)
MAKVMVFYPPGKLYQRGEDRSQGNIEDSTATASRAANDLGYASSTLKKNGHEVFLRDYQNERVPFEDLREDFLAFAPDFMFISITNSTIFSDIRVVNELKSLKPDCVAILKGALFFDPEPELLAQLDLSRIDYLIGGESDFIIAELIEAHLFDPGRIPQIDGILYRSGGDFVPTRFHVWEEDLDSIPFPDRNSLLNHLYTRPDTGEPMATIATSRGCPASCIYCLTPTISGKKVRLRTPENIFQELLDCYRNHGIRNFFFKSDTFTIDRIWVKELCDRIIHSELHGKIEWVANSRVNPIEPETLQYMKQAGCWLVAFGFESGSPETLQKARKGATLDHARKAVAYARQAGLLVFGFFLIGFPWEDRSHLEATRSFIWELKPDFMELHIAVPYYGTELYRIAKEEGLIDETVLGKDYFNAPTIGTKYLSVHELEAFRRKVLLRYHSRPAYIVSKLKFAGARPKIWKNYAKFGIKLLKNNLLKA